MKQSVTVFHVGKKFVCSRKQKDQDFMEQFRALHQSPELELNDLQFLLRSDRDPGKYCPKRLSRRVPKALKNASSVIVEE